MAVESGENLASELIRSFLTLEKIDVNIFRASPINLWKPIAGRFVFGGQVVGQALVAASKTVTEDHHAHSLHCYFLRGGNPNRPILYHVDRTRDGQTYSSRNIKATQEGVPIFTMQASYKTEEVDELQHQFTMPSVPGPEELKDSEDFLRSQLNEDMNDNRRTLILKLLEEKIHVEKRPVNPEVYHHKEQGEPKRFVWVRAIGEMGNDLKLHQCVAGFISDLALLGAAVQPAPPNYRPSFMTSLDHSMWFHNPFKANEWMLYEIESPQCGAGKALSLGRLWKQDGTLAVSIAQEGVVRTTQTDSKL
ncbi:acyl-coenzyme A thioesterase 8-like [Pecten maximus]|uniref:acyl-coenzyme A thioesterase 8-like n=1 Tax=Pecten maximus TaxID=6579 RepID=UPI001458EAF5|nr:acyl-coenzyme A thioesterase 8-like [Pecten maximus]XP_033753727.1 acyl-coenzyme A thioesterase 8-like [Pecten maximus]XP_033753728.1 acyl-coenzyme A thioesterase 8-like [Pecten maximus]